jgi:DNA-binding MarR family transcriptional regulator
MPAADPLAVLNPAIVGQAEKAHAAILKRLLAHTTLDQHQWITLQFAARGGDALSRGDLVTRVAAATQYDRAAVESAIAALINASFMEAFPGADDLVAVTAEGRTLLTTLRSRVSELVGPAYGAITPEDSATAARVLTTITAKLNEELVKTAGTPQRSVLVMGASQRILDEIVAALRDLGYTAQATNEFFGDIMGHFDIANIDVVTLGGLVPADRKAELKEQIRAVNPRVIFLDSLAGIPGLLISQIQGAFAADHQDPAHAPTYGPGDRSIRLTLQDPAAVKVTVFWRTSLIPPDPKSDSLVLFDGRLPGGDHTIPVPAQIPPLAETPSGPRPAQWFAAVQAGEAIYAFGIAAGQ